MKKRNRNLYYLNTNKKSISVLISIILLVVVAVVIVTIILISSQNIINKSLEDKDIETIKKENIDFSLYLINKRSISNKIFIQNLFPNKKDIVIDAYKILDSENKPATNMKIDIADININYGSIKPIEVFCLPNNNFDMLLYSKDNKIYKVNINTGIYDGCGDCICSDSENSTICPQDCDPIDTKPEEPPSSEYDPFYNEEEETGVNYVCGNGFCESNLGEDLENCPQDCNEEREVICGDYYCDRALGENKDNCPMDCR
jgi:hypothetical protein